MRHHAWIVALIALTLSGWLPANAENHAERVANALNAAAHGNTKGIEEAFRKEAKSGDKDELLGTLEIASIYHDIGDFAKSRDWFQKADGIAKGIEGQAIISGADTKGKLGGSIVSEVATQYRGEGFEKILARTLNAINYALLGDVEGALVEVRKAEDYHRLLRESHDKELAKAESKSNDSQHAAASDAIAGAYGTMNAAVADLRNSYENALTYFLAAELYLADAGDPDSLNHAWVDVRRAHELAPNVTAVSDLHRELAQRQLADDSEGLRAELGDNAAQTHTTMEGAEIVVIYQAGLAPRKNDARIPILVPTPSGGIMQTLSFPRYDDLGAPEPSIRVEAAGNATQTEAIVRVGRLSAKALSERMPGIATRAVIRAGTKGAVQEGLNQKGGLFGALLGKIVTNATEIADLRGWYSVPSELAVARMRLPVGAHDVKLMGPNGDEKLIRTSELKKGDVYMINARRMEGRMDAWGVSLKGGAR